MKTYSEDEKSEAMKLYEEGKTKRQIAKILGRTFNGVKGLLNRLRKEGALNIKRGEIFVPSEDSCELVSTDLKLFNETELKREREYIHSKFDDKRAKKILNISDLHIPFHNHNLVKAALKNPADICVVSGDLLDLYSISTFQKDKLIPLQRELSDGASILRMLSDLYPHVVILLANHEKRLLKLLQNKFYDHPELIEVFKKATNIIENMASPYGNIDVVNNWWIKIGEVIFAHPDYYSQVRVKTVQNSYEFFTSIGEDFSAVINAHTHHLSKIIYFRKLLIENPCLCHVMDYMLNGHRKNAEWICGYSLINLGKDGAADFNSTNPYIL